MSPFCEPRCVSRCLFSILFYFSIFYPPLFSSSLCAMLIASRFRCPFPFPRFRVFPLVHKRVSVCILGFFLKITQRTDADVRCLMSLSFHSPLLFPSERHWRRWGAASGQSRRRPPLPHPSQSWQCASPQFRGEGWAMYFLLFPIPPFFWLFLPAIDEIAGFLRNIFIRQCNRT